MRQYPVLGVAAALIVVAVVAGVVIATLFGVNRSIIAVDVSALEPTAVPTTAPTARPTEAPTAAQPTAAATRAPTVQPTRAPATAVASAATVAPTSAPATVQPTSAPATAQPTVAPAPTATPRPAAPAATAGASSEFIEYTVRQGDLLYTIADVYDVSVEELIAINALRNPRSLAVGQVLRIPQKGASPTIAWIEYTVQRGDLLYTIAEQHDVSIEELVAINRIRNPSNLTVGQVIRIPKR